MVKKTLSVILFLLMIQLPLWGQYDSIFVDGRWRTFLTHLPPSYQPNQDTLYSLILALHGGFGSAYSMQYQSQLSQKADTDQKPFIVVYPEGVKSPAGIRTWNAGDCCGYARDHNFDDVHFIAVLIDTLLQRYKIDPLRVYATGMSNGGMMCYRLAAELTWKIAAIAPVAASMVLDGPWTPSRPMPIIHFHSYQDEDIPYYGGVGNGYSKHYNPPVDSVLNAWSDLNGCASENDTLYHVVGDYLFKVWRQCFNNADIHCYVTYDGGHSWPGGKPPTPNSDPPSEKINANDLMWEFFLQHPALTPPRVVISEIMKDPAAVADSLGEWIEIFNYGSQDLDINGWILRDRSSDIHTIQNNGPLWLRAGAFLVLGIESDSTRNGGVHLNYTYTNFYLDNNDDQIILLQSDGQTEVDRVTYYAVKNWPSTPGASMVFAGSATDNNNDPSYWSSATEPWPGSQGDKGSPGYAGPDQPLHVKLVGIEFKIQEDGIEIRWTTASEWENAGFEIYRSVTDRSHFQLIADYNHFPQLRGQGYSTLPHHYVFLDKNVETGWVYWYRLASVDYHGKRHFYSKHQVIYVLNELEPGLPTRFALYPPRPNPFNSQTTLPVDIPAQAENPIVKLVIVDIHGRKVATLWHGKLTAGRHIFQWLGQDNRGRPVASGVYFAVLQEPDGRKFIQKLVLLR